MRTLGVALCITFSLAHCVSLASAQPAAPPVINGHALAGFWHAASHTRVDVVDIGDSNQLFGGHGWDRGWTRALASRVGLYASGLHSCGENIGNSSGVGDGTSTVSTRSGGAFTYTGAPPFFEQHMNAAAALNGPLSYLSLAEGSTASGSFSTGMLIDSNSPIGITSRLRFHLSYGVFAGAGPGSFRPAVRLDVPPYTNFPIGSVVSTRGTEDAILHTAIELPAGPRAGPLNFRLARANIDTITGPFIAYYARIENADRLSGAANHTLYAYGGRSARSMAQFFRDFSDESLTHFFREVRRTQGDRKPLLVRLHSALNDRNETRPSIDAGILPGNSGAAYADNMQAIINRLRSLYASNGWDDADLYFVITPSHPIAPADEPSLTPYRVAAEALAAANPRTAAVHFDRLTTYEEMLTSGWYATILDRNHLTIAGYDRLGQREVDALLAAAGCPADIDRDDDVDSDDVVQFFATWEAGERPADADADGDTDSDDIVEYFTAWDLGC